MLTLLEASKLHSGDVLRSGVIEHFARSSELLNILSFMDIPGNAYKYNTEQSLPGVGFRGINEAFEESTGVLNPQTEGLAIAGGDLDVDKFIVDTMGAAQRTQQELMKVKALAGKITKTLIKGDAQTNIKEFDGLQTRVTGSQLIAAGSTSGGDALSLDKLDEAIDQTDNPTHILLNKAMRRKLTKAARTSSVSGDIEYKLNQFGVQVAYYNGLPLVIIDRDEENADILPFTEANPGGGSPASTSLYVIDATPDALAGIQNGVMSVRDLGEQNSKSVYRTRVEWFLGFGIWKPRAVTRLYGIKNAAVVA